MDLSVGWRASRGLFWKYWSGSGKMKWRSLGGSTHFEKGILNWCKFHLRDAPLSVVSILITHTRLQISKRFRKDLCNAKHTHTNTQLKAWPAPPFSVDCGADAGHMLPPVLWCQRGHLLGSSVRKRGLCAPGCGCIYERKSWGGVGICLIPLSAGSSDRQLLPHLLPCWMDAWWLSTAHLS